MMSLEWQQDGDLQQQQQSSPDGGSSSEAGAEWQPHDQLLYADQQHEQTGEGAVARPHVDQSQLLCRTGCGFYGFPAWEGHCSKCYKQLQSKAATRRTTRITRPVFDPTNIKNKVSRSVSDVSDLSGRASMLLNRKIDKLDEKRRQQLDKHKNNNIVKSIFRKSYSQKSGGQAGAAAGLPSDSSTSASQELDTFLKGLSAEGGGAVRKQLSMFCDKLRRTVHTQSLEDTADQLQELYNNIHNMVTTHHAFAGLTSEDVSRAVSLTERYVTTRLHQQLTDLVNARCEEQDLAIQNRIRSLAWVSAEMLESKLDEGVASMATALDTIIGELLELHGKAVPSDKLNVLVSCSHLVLQALSSASSAPASADDFLPALIYCVIRANPPMLHSNIAYVTNFALHSQLQSGEAGYYFTNLCCAVAFIEKVCGASLGLTEQEFERHMSGTALPLHPGPPPSITAITNTLQRFTRALDTVDTITADYQATMKEMLQLQASVSEKVATVLQETPMVTRPPHTSAEILRLVRSSQHQLLEDDLAQRAGPPLSVEGSHPPGGGQPPSAAPPSPAGSKRPAEASTAAAATAGGRSDKLVSTLPESEQAFNLYYSLEDFITADPNISSPRVLSESANTSLDQLPNASSTSFMNETAGSLLDEPILDNTVPLLDQGSSRYESNTGPQLEQGSPRYGGTGPLLDQVSPRYGGSSSSNRSLSLMDEPVSPPLPSSLLPLSPCSGFRAQSNHIPSIACDTGPASLPCGYSSSTPTGSSSPGVSAVSAARIPSSIGPTSLPCSSEDSRLQSSAVQDSVDCGQLPGAPPQQQQQLSCATSCDLPLGVPLDLPLDQTNSKNMLTRQFIPPTQLQPSGSCDDRPPLPAASSSDVNTCSTGSAVTSNTTTAGAGAAVSSVHDAVTPGAADAATTALAAADTAAPDVASTSVSQVAAETEQQQSPQDAFSSPQHRPALPPPLLPVVTPLPSSSSGCVEQQQQAPSAAGAVRKDTLDKVVDVLAGIADSIDQLLTGRFHY